MTINRNRLGACAICFHIRPVTKHHLEPKKVTRSSRTIFICRACHDLVHQLFTHDQLMTATWPEVSSTVKSRIEAPPAVEPWDVTVAKMAVSTANLPWDIAIERGAK